MVADVVDDGFAFGDDDLRGQLMGWGIGGQGMVCTSFSDPAGVMPIVGERPRGWNFFSSGPARPSLLRLNTWMSYSSLSSSRSQMTR